MSRSKRFLPVLALLTGLALAAGTQYSIIVGGQVAPDKAIVVNGQTYVPLSALKLLGINSTLKGTTLTLGSAATAANQTPGGANQRPSLEGCLGETLFNGIWRLKVTRLEAIKRDPGTPLEAPGWGLTVELRNGARGTLSPTDTGVSGTGEGIQLALPDGRTLNVDPLDVQGLTFASLPQGGVVIRQLKFYSSGTDPARAQKPVKFLFQINPKGFEDAIRRRAGGASYTTPTPSFRVRLDCQR
ncbi:hypothetical protein DAERI_070099 [Deinococcus aerius]|uniref:Copper amine oxidase-like N-terminal domain-containing protein n=1 Tax=Deinococcus aerius TaxID=200253 RepID=A0A2I9DM73_9DEIO|nr:hypothetical protein [Deinococcus aerius]GBF06101.1 hypothetical protein DAERI_070099 [Deinococcus aerius]